MPVFDLTQVISPTMPVYPGTEPPHLDPANTYEQSGFRETLLTLYSHTGTHMDAPAHLFAARTTLDALAPEHFLGTALVIRADELPEGARVGMDHIRPVLELAQKADFLLIRTGWDQYWGTPKYFGAYPCVTEEVVDFLLQTGKKGIGLDTIGLDPIADEGLTLHRRLLAKQDVVVIENLRGLERLGDGLVYFAALPLKFENADGAPIRALAWSKDALPRI